MVFSWNEKPWPRAGNVRKKKGGLVSHDVFLKKVRVILRFWLLVLRSVAFFFNVFLFLRNWLLETLEDYEIRTHFDDMYWYYIYLNPPVGCEMCAQK